ncbi:MAG: 4Fe-4S double cluster binding domain-containing protein [Moorellales bacterium]
MTLDTARPGQDLRARLEEWVRRQGIDLWGVADLEGQSLPFCQLAPELVASFPRAVSLAVRVSPMVLSTVADGPNLLYYHHYRQLNFWLDRLALALARQLEAWGGRALALPASQVVDWEEQRGHLCHRRVAQLAGLGWRGRNNLLVTPRYGSQVRLVSVLTDLLLPADRPLDRDCGHCRRCLSVCPAGAIKEDPADFDHRACFEQLKTFGRERRIGQYICGICVRACSGREKA